MRFGETPKSDEAEISVLGAAMMDADAADEVIEKLDPADFFNSKNRDIFESIISLRSRGAAPDALSVREEMRSAGTFDEDESPEYLAMIVEAIPTAANATYHANVVSEHSTRRKLIKAASRVVELAREGSDLDDVREESERAVFDATQSESYSTTVSGADLARRLKDRLENPPEPGLPTPLDDLNEYVGLHPKRLMLVAARPGMGKTALGVQLAVKAAFDLDAPTLFFSLEMGVDEIGQRIIAAESGLDLHELSQPGFEGRATQDQLGRYYNVLDRMVNGHLHVDERATLTPLELRAVARRHKRRHGLGLIVVDYLQLMHSRGENRTQEVSRVSRGLKSTAMELGVPVVALSQLSRGPESRENKRPRLADLRESGQLEQDAHEVIMLYREDYYNEKEAGVNGKRGVAEIIVAKNRNGPTGTVEARWDAKSTRFLDLAPGYREDIAPPRDSFAF